MSKRKGVTAAELMARLEQDPDFVSRRAEAERVHQERSKVLLEAEKPLLDELRRAGFEIQSVWDFVNCNDRYPNAVPILLRHLSLPYPPAVREGVARALAVREAASIWPTLVAMFRNEEGKRVKDGLAVAVAEAATSDRLDEIVELLLDRSLGSTRVLLLSAVLRFRTDRTSDILAALQDDPDLAKEVALLQKRRAKKK